MSFTFKYRGKRSEVTMLLVQAFYGFKYRVIHSTCSTLLDMAPRWRNEEHYLFREDLNNQLKKAAAEKYNVRPPNLIDITNKRVWICIPYNDKCKMFGMQITWNGHNDFTFFCSFEDEEAWPGGYLKAVKEGYEIGEIFCFCTWTPAVPQSDLLGPSTKTNYHCRPPQLIVYLKKV